MDSPASPKEKIHVLTVHLEDYFQVGTLRSVIPPKNWYRFETRVEKNTVKTLELLEEHNLKATFFCLGWIADQLPGLVRAVSEKGHEVASKGYLHRSLREMQPGEFRSDLIQSREAIERATGKKVHGFRAARGWMHEQDFWALDILAEEGFSYDSSFCPLGREFSGDRSQRFAHRHKTSSHDIWEFPLSTVSLLGFSLPIAGGNYLRQIPDFLMRRAVAHWDATCESPFVMYFHVWELDPQQPRINAAPLFQRIRQYRNLGKMSRVIPDYLSRYSFKSIAEFLDLPDQPAAPHVVELNGSLGSRLFSLPSSHGRHAQARKPLKEPIPITIVVPCYNEELSLPYLANTLKSVEERLSPDYVISYAFVDDNSKDATWETLQKIFGNFPRCDTIRHPRNLGVAAAIMTGIRNAKTELICSIDCDCTYDPHQLESLLPLMEEGVDLVTASPYHPLGKVLNVPGWRLGLSKTLSAIYGLIVRQKLATYTSCFRVYRRSTVAEIQLQESGFLGVAEMVILLDLLGRRIVECPAVLEVRLLGQSKMKVLRTILGHLRLIARLIWEKRDLRKNRLRDAHSGSIPKVSIDGNSPSLPTANQGR